MAEDAAAEEGDEKADEEEDHAADEGRRWRTRRIFEEDAAEEEEKEKEDQKRDEQEEEGGEAEAERKPRPWTMNSTIASVAPSDSHFACGVCLFVYSIFFSCPSFSQRLPKRREGRLVLGLRLGKQRSGTKWIAHAILLVQNGVAPTTPRKQRF